MTPSELHKRLSGVNKGLCNYGLEKCAELAPKINRINELKKSLNAVILAHTYVAPEIICGAADFTGDSYYLSDKARGTQADTIVFVAVRFMAETAKILNPGKRVILPNTDGGCTLAEAITAAKVRRLRAKYPEHTFVCYINTTAEVKAECYACVTSSNVGEVVANLPSKKIYFLPDRYMGQNLADELTAKGVKKELLFYEGSCYAHEAYEPEIVEYTRLKYPGLLVAVHPECKPEVVAKADFTGSTSGIYEYVKKGEAPAYLLLTECGLSARIQAEMPDKKIVGTCNFCRYMQANNLDRIIEAMEDKSGAFDIQVPEMVLAKARRCIERMFDYARA